jgi:hypothetical protein
METLPNELVTMISDLLDMKDILSARRVWKNFAAVGMAILQQDFTRLYIHPTRLREVIGVCNHPDLSKNISEIVIVGKQATPSPSPIRNTLTPGSNK